MQCEYLVRAFTDPQDPFRWQDIDRSGVELITAYTRGTEVVAVFRKHTEIYHLPYEHKIVMRDLAADPFELDRLGQERWELVTVLAPLPGSRYNSPVYFFKRVQDSTPASGQWR